MEELVERPDAGPAPKRATRRLQNGLFAAFFAAVGISVGFGVMTYGNWSSSRESGFDLGLTPFANSVLLALLGVLMIALAFSLLTSPRKALAISAMVAAVLDYVFFIMFPGDFDLLIWWTGAVALATGSLLGFRMRRAPRSATKVLGMVVAGFFTLFACAFWLSNVIGQEYDTYKTMVVRQASPDGNWLAEAHTMDFESTGARTYVSVERTYLGVVSRWREVFTGPGPLSGLSWLDERTLLVDGQRFDIYKDIAVSD